MAILGAGTIANKMAATITRMETVEAYAIAARDLDRAQSFAAKYGIEKAYGSYEQMLADDAVDLVYIAVPHSHHNQFARQCLEAEKHVLCEKPFMVNEKQAREIYELAESRHLLAAEAMWTRYMPSRDMIRRVIDSGAIGEVTSLTANLGYELENVKRIWAPDLAGGALLDVGCYLVHFARMIFGEQVRSLQSAAVFRNGVDMADSISMTFEGGKLATMQCNVYAAQDRRGTIFGTKGYLEIQNINNPEQLRVYNDRYELVEQYEVPAQITGFEYEVQACVDAIGEGRTECPQLTHKESVASLKVLDEIRACWMAPEEYRP